nr:MAG TPA: hypothetical protein [Caudoviricetes sp.]
MSSTEDILLQERFSYSYNFLRKENLIATSPKSFRYLGELRVYTTPCLRRSIHNVTKLSICRE